MKGCCQMAMCYQPIGVMDSGIGGLTVVRELQRLLPGEDLIYFGDSANCPYGNRTPDQIEQLSKNILGFLEECGVKVTAIACNTISALADRLIPAFSHKIISIVIPAANAVVFEGLREVGLIATEFTVQSGAYEQLIHEFDPSIEVFSQGSPLLAWLVDRGDFNDDEIDTEIITQIDKILARRKVRHIILGCTHYPIIGQNFARCYPGVTFIDPALEQTKAISRYLGQQHLLSDRKQGRFVICTSGDPQVYLQVVRRLGLREPDEIRVVKL